MTTVAQDQPTCTLDQIARISSLIVTALVYLNGDKYKQVQVDSDPSETTEVTILAETNDTTCEKYRVRDIVAFEQEAQTYFEALWERNPDKGDYSYLACVAYETTLKKYFEGMVNGGSTSETGVVNPSDGSH